MFEKSYTPANFRPFRSLCSHTPLSLRILDLVIPKAKAADCGRQAHLRLIQDVMRTNSHQLNPNQDRLDDAYLNPNGDPVLKLFRMNREGLGLNPSVVSQALSSCGSERTVNIGIQVHCFAIKTGFLANVFVGSSLTSFYSKCGELDCAYEVFDEMPVRNVVSWTTIISGFAQKLQVDGCLELYNRMRNSTIKPNDFTLTSLLSACMGSGTLGQGMSTHCQAIQMGFDSYLHVSNTLISMYSKCGDVKGALYIFENMGLKDLVSWNSMIVGYALHGLALQAIDLFERMKKAGLEPDAITFLGVLSSCRHAGFVEQGQFYFNSMVDFSLEPEMDHYSCMVDLLGRAGDIKGTRDFIKKMPFNPNAVVWGSLLSACRLHGNVWIGIEAAERRIALEPECAATHLQLVNFYASVGWWDQVARVRKLMRDKGVKTDPGYSWVEIGNEVHIFRAEYGLGCRTDGVTILLDGLVDHMRNFGYVPEIYEIESDYDLHEKVFQ